MHEYPKAELAAYRKELIEAEVRSEQTILDGLYQKRSQLYFTSASSSPDTSSIDGTIAQTLARISFLRKLDPAKVIVTSPKPVQFVQGQSGQQLLAAPALSAADTARERKLDFVVTGSVTQVEQYLVVRIRGYDAALDELVVSYDDTVPPNGALTVADTVTNGLAKAILGRDFADLAVASTPPSALLYLDGDFVGIGNARVNWITVGHHTLKAQAPGYAPETEEVDIGPSQTKSVEMTLVQTERPQIVVRSYPAGADVYVSSQWAGKTPIVLERPESDVALMLQLKGFYEYIGSLSPESPESVNLHLTPDSFNRDTYVSNLRDRFYSSFGAFVLSMVLPVTFFSMVQDYGNAVLGAGSTAEQQRLLRLYDVWYYSYIGSGFIAASLFVNMAVDIGTYVGASR